MLLHGFPSIEAIWNCYCVGVVKLHHAICIGSVSDQALPIEEVGSGFESICLTWRSVEFEVQRATGPLLDRRSGGVFDGHKFRSTLRIHQEASVVNVVTIIDNKSPRSV